jgi:hypothetical protein
MINQTEINALTAKREEITYCRFNQDCTCLVVGTKILGFYIYKLSPLQLIYSSASDSSEPMHCVCVEMCYTSNIMAIVQTPAKIAAKKDQGPLLLSPVISKPTPHNFDRVLRDDISSTSGRRSDYTVRPLTKKDVMMFDAQRKEGVYIISLA